MSPTVTVDQPHLARGGSDPLGVLASCAVVVNASLHVTIDSEAVDRLANTLVAQMVSAPVWDEAVHYRGTGPDATERTIGWIFVLDALNFCFWSQGPNPGHRWRIASGGATYDGYMALAIALRDVARSGIPIWDVGWQSTVDDETINGIFRPAPGSAPIPLLPQRTANLRELGQAMRALDLGDSPYRSFVGRAGGSAPRLVRAIVDTFPSFRDVAWWTPPGSQGSATEVRFYKRAQILVSDLAGAFAGHPEMVFHDTGQLTAFADYKVPQVLRHHEVLRYGSTLAGRIQARDRIAPGSREEVEIRAATIWGCELLRQALADLGADFAANDVDWLLWNLGQSLPATCEPYHRTVTVFY